MTHDALSRAINGQRHFSALEIAALAEHLNVDTHWLITGQRDQFQVRLAARHPWGQSSPEQEQSDNKIITRVIEAYRAAYEELGHVPTSVATLPSDAAELRALVASEGVRELAEQLEDVLGIDVVRDPGLQTDYSFRVGQHAVVLLRSTTYWFRANWSIAHELGHLALGHHVDERTTQADEGPADAFASHFLLPEPMVRETDWQAMTARSLARWLWSAGVSTAALSRRLREMGITVSLEAQGALQESTPRLMRANVDVLRSLVDSRSDPIRERENATTGRQFPEHLVTALTNRVEEGKADPYLLSWVRDVPVDDLDWPEPDLDAPLPERVANRFQERERDWLSLLDAR